MEEEKEKAQRLVDGLDSFRKRIIDQLINYPAHIWDTLEKAPETTHPQRNELLDLSEGWEELRVLKYPLDISILDAARWVRGIPEKGRGPFFDNKTDAFIEKILEITLEVITLIQTRFDQGNDEPH